MLCLSCVRTVSFPTTRGRERKASSRSIESWGYRPGACAPGIIHSILSIIDELAAGGEGVRPETSMWEGPRKDALPLLPAISFLRRGPGGGTGHSACGVWHHGLDGMDGMEALKVQKVVRDSAEMADVKNASACGPWSSNYQGCRGRGEFF